MTATPEDLGRELEVLWASLGAPPESGTRVVDLPQRSTHGTFFLGVAPDGRRLLLPLEPGRERTFREDRRSDVVQLRLTAIETEGARVSYVEVVCLDDHLGWIFATFVADLLVRIERDHAAPEGVARKCLDGWRALFAGGGRRLGPKQLAGLFGELLILERVLGRNPDAVECWRGPLREPHDFVGPAGDVEVKATLSDEDEVVHVHGIDQLQAPSYGPLYLVHLRLDNGSASGRTVPELVEELEGRDRCGRLRALLTLSGFHARHEEHYRARFEVVAEQWFAVAEDFPRLTPGSFINGHVPAGLAGFSYSLDLTAVGTPPLAATESDGILEEVMA